MALISAIASGQFLTILPSIIHGASPQSTSVISAGLQFRTATSDSWLLPVPIEWSCLIVPTLIMRGQWDGIASVDDLLKFFDKLPNPDKQFTVMPGISHASFQQKNYMLVYHILWSFFTQPEPVYRG